MSNPDGSRPLTGPDALMSEERRMQIVQLVRERGRVLVHELSDRFSTSAVTISFSNLQGVRTYHERDAPETARLAGKALAT